jgi:Secretion system C-terminal sorting domain
MKKRTLCMGLLSSCLLFLSTPTFAQQGAKNDECSSASILTYCVKGEACTPMQINPLNATLSKRAGTLGETDCMSNEGVDVWYNFQAEDEALQVEVTDEKGETNGYMGFEIMNDACGSPDLASAFCYHEDPNNQGCGIARGLKTTQFYCIRLVFTEHQDKLFNVTLRVPSQTSIENCQAKVLPIRLTSFTAQKGKANTVILDWQTSTEYNTHHFDVERSLNGIDFVPIAALRANGNSNKVLDYQYVDREKASNKIVYYRLKSMDNDQHFEYSSIVALTFPTLTTISASPNPFSQQLVVELQSKEEGTVELLDISGRMLATEQIAASEEGEIQQHTFNTADLATGIYLVRYRTNYQAVVQKVIKE